MLEEGIIKEYFEFLNNTAYPCLAAKSAIKQDHIRCLVVGDMASAADDMKILKFMNEFVEFYRNSTSSFYSAAIIFKLSNIQSEEHFDAMMWQRLAALRDEDRKVHQHDHRVSDDPESPEFSFSLAEEAFFVIGLNPMSTRKARRFTYPTLVFNPHAEFEKLRDTNKYESMKSAVRKRDEKFSGSVNPMLMDFGTQSEVFQYSGIQYSTEWKCPFKRYS